MDAKWESITVAFNAVDDSMRPDDPLKMAMAELGDLLDEYARQCSRCENPAHPGRDCNMADSDVSSGSPGGVND